ncbi:MAG TPA: erythromycin esterase family protein [Tepidisphaeraceae bacterium]|jgi:erythromycin esterase-like protein
MPAIHDKFVDLLRTTVHVLEGGPDDFDPLLRSIGDCRFVLIGEASHGTHEFYKTRADITRRLICEKGFNAVIVEADWPDAWRVNRFVRGFNEDQDATEALDGFKRFPQWMWRNADVLNFVGWLRERNDSLGIGAGPSDPRKVGFYGMDLYSLYTSIQAVLEYLDKVDPAAAARARYRYGCFEDHGEDAQAYGYAASFDLDRSCEDEAVRQLVELRRHAAENARRDGRMAEDEQFDAEQNARVVQNAEEYYRSMFHGHVLSWNLRDTHMVETINELVRFLDRRIGGLSKIAVWAHNSHLGDARATEVSRAGERNVGQLMREQNPGDVFSIGFSTYSGTVTAADDWDGTARRMQVRPALPGSYEALFHETNVPGFLLDVRGTRDGAAPEDLRQPKLQRAIGVIYKPETERLSHYYHARLADQFDAMIHVDRTRAVEPLETKAQPPRILQEAETYPTGV